MDDQEATKAAAPAPTWTRPLVSGPYPTVLGYLLWLVLAELVLAAGALTGDSSFYVAGIFADVFLLVALVVHATWIHSAQPKLSAFLTALVLAPLVRVASLSAPFAPFSVLEFLVFVAIALLLGSIGVAVVLGLRPADLRLWIGTPRVVVANAGIAAGGIGLGVVEFYILRPEPWISALTLEAFVLGGIVVFLATGLAEELIFRGALLTTAERAFGRRRGLLLVTIVFTVLHIGFLSPLDFGFVFLAGLYFGVTVQETKSLYGAVGAHTLANVMLYLVLPFVL